MTTPMTKQEEKEFVDSLNRGMDNIGKQLSRHGWNAEWRRGKTLAEVMRKHYEIQDILRNTPDDFEI